MIKYQNITKSFNGHKVLDNISFHIKGGRISAYIGPNGAGKTTTINLMLGFLHADNGIIIHPWGDNADIRSKIGCMLALPTGTQNLTVYENLVFYARLYGVGGNRIASALDKTGLAEMKQARLFSLSSGYKKKFDIALALLNDSDLIVMDEPTANLDVDSKKEIIQLINELKREGRTFFITSHDLHFISEIADVLIFLKDGRIYCELSRNDLLKRFDGQRFRIIGDISKTKSYNEYIDHLEREKSNTYLLYSSNKERSQCLLEHLKNEVKISEQKALTLYDIYPIIFSERNYWEV